ncbi:sunset domain-containing protein [Salinifilum ghardaiensis]
MTSWLFTQVWLWSFAAFVLGVLVNFVLFVRPLQKRLRAREEDLARLEEELAAGPLREAEPPTEPPREAELLDILDERGEDDERGWQAWTAPAERGEPAAPAESSDMAAPAESSAPAERGAPAKWAGEQPADESRTRPQLRAPHPARSPAVQDPAAQAPGAADTPAAQDTGAVRSPVAQNEGADPHAPTAGAAPVEQPGAEPARRAPHPFEQGEHEVSAGPLAPRPYTFDEPATRPPRPDIPGPDTPGPETPGGATREVPVEPELPIRFSATPPGAVPFEAAEQDASGNTWFQKPALEEPAGADTAAEQPAPPRPAQQEPEQREPAEQEPAQQEPAEQEPGTRADEGTSEAAARAAAATAARWRRRGEVSVRGSLTGVAPDGAERPEHDSGAPEGARDEGAAQPAAAPEEPEEAERGSAAPETGSAEAAPGESDAGLPRRTPGAAERPGPDGEILAGSVGPLIKGHAASRQYHTPDSPQYDGIVADVWFRTTEDAETAGFRSWDG